MSPHSPFIQQLCNLPHWISQALNPTWLARGRNYHAQGRVHNVQISESDRRITAQVQGSRKRAYNTLVQFDTSGAKSRILGECDCPVGWNCKHVAATLLQASQQVSQQVTQQVSQQALRNSAHGRTDSSEQGSSRSVASAPRLSPELSLWLESLKQQSENGDATPWPNTVNNRLLYILALDSEQKLRVFPRTAYLKKGGAWGKVIDYDGSRVLETTRPPAYLLEEDLSIMRDLESARRREGVQSKRGDGYPLATVWESQLLRKVLETGRCYWKKHQDSPPVTLASPLPAEPVWATDDRGNQNLGWQVGDANSNHGSYTILPLASPWALDTTDMQCHPLETSLPAALTGLLSTTPTIPPQLAPIVHRQLQRELGKSKVLSSIPLPQAMGSLEERIVKPLPRLRLTTATVGERRYWRYGEDRVETPLLFLSFLYQEVEVGQFSPHNSLTRFEGETLVQMPRDKGQEQLFTETLLDLDETVQPLSGHATLRALRKEDEDAMTFSAEESEYRDDDAFNFTTDCVPQLRQQGWKIEIDPQWPYQILYAEEPWALELSENSSGIDWFDLSVVTTIEGERTSLLPLLVQTLKMVDSSALIRDLEQGREGTLFTELPDQRTLAISTQQLKPLLLPLLELFSEPKLEKGGSMTLGLSQLPQLLQSESQQADTSTTTPYQLEITGSQQQVQRLRQLREKLQHFTHIPQLDQPGTLQATLRPYQLEGLSWLQFLRDLGLGGILADDMGLGKTIQTLAHLLCEQQAGRLQQPALVVAPTSLMFNWQAEARRFAPALKVLLLHGTRRKEHFSTLEQYDLVLTTYPLLVRDREVLQSRSWHLLILDEAQAIKNPKSRASMTVRELQAEHRLCLTGTPMENHLGELWALMDFLNPGLLGDSKRFRKLFRTPIEKQGESERQALLSRRVAPFLLRRTKDQVAQELPERSEIIRSVALEGDQATLYESIRLSMQQKIQQEIAKKGLNRSHIIVLDALLKLRQVCCDPRLLKMKSAAGVKRSAKLDLLMQQLPEMIEEGRRILLFSQFTSMLELIEEQLQQAGIDYLKLTGQTRDRAAPVERFQRGEVPLFLISLKAGGVGLNLTAADTVIHYDPWWNPAVERQATDRAHRIGQDKRVFVYKYITERTVEEKIQQMQQKKQALADALFSQSQNSGNSLTEADLLTLFEPLEEV